VCVCVCVCVGISEASLTGESVIKKKGPFVLGEGPESAVKVSPALFQGTLVQEGQGRMLVLAVGENTYQGLMTKKMEEEEDEKTVLQTKLDDMTELITKAGAVAGCCTVGILLLRFALAFMNHACCKESFNHKIHHLEWLRFLVVGVTVFVVAVPEGLPLAVAITLSLSVGKMQKDNCLVRHMSSCETMGSATTICSDKTGTLTTGKMTVVKVWSGGQSDPTVRETVSRLSGMCVCVCVCMFSVCVVTLLALFSAAADDAGGGGGDQLVVQVGRDIQ
jgi:Ca2+-transporting ATPase